MKYFFVALTAIIFLSLLLLPASAANLNAYINPESQSSKFTIQYQRVVFIDYPDGGQIADDLKSKEWNIEMSADSSNLGVQDLMQKLNQKIKDDGSSTRITDLNVEYYAKLHGRGQSTAIDYKVELTGSISDYIIHQYSPDNLALIDMGWRGITTDDPIVIDGFEINIPISILKSREPTLSSLLSGTEAETILSQHLIDAQGFVNQPLAKWHFLYDPTGINADKSNFGSTEEVSSFAVSSFVLSDYRIREGSEKKLEASITADKEYLVRSIESSDSAKINVIGFAAVDRLDGIEIIGVTPEPPEGYSGISIESPDPLILTGIVAVFLSPIILGIVAFVISRKIIRKITHQKNIGRKNSMICIIVSLAVFILSGIPFLFFQYWYSLFESFLRT